MVSLAHRLHPAMSWRSELVAANRFGQWGVGQSERISVQLRAQCQRPAGVEKALLAKRSPKQIEPNLFQGRDFRLCAPHGPPPRTPAYRPDRQDRHRGRVGRTAPPGGVPAREGPVTRKKGHAWRLCLRARVAAGMQSVRDVCAARNAAVCVPPERSWRHRRRSWQTSVRPRSRTLGHRSWPRLGSASQYWFSLACSDADGITSSAEVVRIG